MNNKVLLYAVMIVLCDCAAVKPKTPLYERLGGDAGIKLIVDNFVTEISYDPQIAPFFQKTKISRFKEKLAEQICEVSDGPCRYSGDSMIQSHQSMVIDKGDFNRTVELLMRAMDKAHVAVADQNRLLEKLAKTQGNIVNH